MMKCVLCGLEDPGISSILKVCRNCIKNNPEAEKFIEEAHRISKSRFNLPSFPPKDGKLECPFCENKCKLNEGEFGFCGLVKNENNRLKRFWSEREAILEYYYDPLPTNCVANPVCPECLNPKLGSYNLAVFFGSCNLDCLFCQNWEYKFLTYEKRPKISLEELLDAVNEKVRCICFFGGDPGTQVTFTIKFSEEVLEKYNIRICYETNGLINRYYLKKIADIVLNSGGIIKVDLKAWDEKIYKALTGCSNKRVIKNIEFLASYFSESRNPPFLVISTLLVPHYVSLEEIENIAKFIRELNPNIPYILLAFYPCYLMNDLPCTSYKHAKEAIRIAKKQGLKRVFLENKHLLQNKIDYSL